MNICFVIKIKTKISINVSHDFRGSPQQFHPLFLFKTYVLLYTYIFYLWFYIAFEGEIISIAIFEVLPTTYSIFHMFKFYVFDKGLFWLLWVLLLCPFMLNITNNNKHFFFFIILMLDGKILPEYYWIKEKFMLRFIYASYVFNKKMMMKGLWNSNERIRISYLFYPSIHT